MSQNPFAGQGMNLSSEHNDGDYNVASAGGGGGGGGGGGAWGSVASAWNFGGPTAAAQNQSTPKATEKRGGLDNREVEIKRREEKLAEREKELNNMEQNNAIRAGGVGVVPVKNWPPFSPIIYHDIAAEIPVALQGIVKRAYYTYLFFIGTLLYNFLCVTLSFSVDIDFIGWIFSGIYMVTGVPGAFIVWYGRIYNAASYDRACTYMCFFIGMIIHVAFCIWAAIPVPIPSNAATGFINTLDMFKDSKWLGIMYVIGFLLWIFNILASIYIWQDAMRGFRNQGGPQKLQKETQVATGRAIVAGATVNRV